MTHTVALEENWTCHQGIEEADLLIVETRAIGGEEIAIGEMVGVVGEKEEGQRATRRLQWVGVQRRDQEEVLERKQWMDEEVPEEGERGKRNHLEDLWGTPVQRERLREQKTRSLFVISCEHLACIAMAFFSIIIISGCRLALHSIVCVLEQIYRYHREEGTGDDIQGMSEKFCERVYL